VYRLHSPGGKTRLHEIQNTVIYGSGSRSVGRLPNKFIVGSY
jgi:hypothetical protein